MIGTLATGQDTPCIQLIQDRPPAVALLWPAGFTAKASPLRVYDAQGTQVAAEGDTVTAGGLYVDAFSAACHTQGYFEVLEIKRGGEQASFAP
jgi:hypothetical protein